MLRQHAEHIGEEVTEKLDFEPAQVKVREQVRLQVCLQGVRSSGAAEAGPQIVTADKPLSPIEKGLAAPGLLAYVIVSKYCDHLPLHRLERILERHGIDIARSTMCDWMRAVCRVAQAALQHHGPGSAGLPGDPHRRHAGGRAGSGICPARPDREVLGVPGGRGPS